MGPQTTSIVFMVLIFVVFYFMLIRPQRKRDKEISTMRQNLTIGDEIITIGGIHGKIVKVNDEIVVIELSHAKQRITLGKWAIGSVSKKANKKVEEKTEEKTEEKPEKDEKKDE